MGEGRKLSNPEEHNGENQTEAGSANGSGKKPWKGIQVWKGIGLVALLHLLLFIYPAAFFLIGVVQLIYVIPALSFVYKNPGMVQGILIGAGITFLINAACFGIVLGSLAR